MGMSRSTTIQLISFIISDAMSETYQLPTISDVWSAAGRIYPVVSHTPLIASSPIETATVHLKLELLQPTGSFKVRGAANTILSLTEEEKERGVITFSTGNHGRAVSYVAHQVGVKAVVCLSQRVPSYRVAAIKALGGTPVVHGSSQDEAEDHYAELKKEKGYVPVVPFDDPRVIAGQGTIAMEMLQQRPEVDTLLVPLSGGGLLAGIAMTAKTLKPTIRVVGISIERSPAMLESLKQGRPAEIPEQDTLADSLLGGIGRENHYTMELVKQFVDEHVVVTEDDIEVGMRYLFNEHGIVAEGAAAVGIGAILSGKVDVTGCDVITPLTGRNVDTERYLSVIQRER